MFRALIMLHALLCFV